MARAESSSTTAPVASPAANGPPITDGFDGHTIRIGILSTTVHPIWGTIGRVINAGIEAHVAAINRRGGIAGRYPIELVRAETNYDPTQTAAQLNATRDRVVAYVSILGTPNVEAIEPLLRDLQMVAGPASQEARWATAPNLLPVGNSYQVQAINGISYFAETFATTTASPATTAGSAAAVAVPGRPTTCAVSVATSFGDAGTEGFRFAQDHVNVNPGPVIQVSPTETQFASAVGQLKAAGCNGVLLTVGPAQTLGIALTGRALGFTPRWIIIGASFNDKIITPQTGPLFEQGAWVVGDGTEWGDPTAPGMARIKSELIDSNNRYWTENPDVGLTFGWMQARTMEAVLERAVARNDLTHAGVLAASQEIGLVDTLGLASPVDYSKPTRLANARTTIYAVDGSYRNAIRNLARDYTSPAAQAYRK